MFCRGPGGSMLCILQSSEGDESDNDACAPPPPPNGFAKAGMTPPFPPALPLGCHVPDCLGTTDPMVKSWAVNVLCGC